ncbi:MAG: hypothetical protein IVW55_02790 [Chloroflexi bacterium]|nr:hypothetical protein [Chloroflexota bacterium]
MDNELQIGGKESTTISPSRSYPTANTSRASRFTFHVSRVHFTFLTLWVRAHSTALSALLALTLLYIAALVVMPPDALTQHDTGAKYLQVRNLRLTPAGLDWSINYPARPLDPNLQFVPFNPKQYYVDSKGRIYLQWPIFLGLLTRIPWKIMGFWGLYLVPLLAGLGTAFASYLLALTVGVPRRIAWLVVPVVGLATPLFIYSLLFFEHTLAALLVTLSLLAAAAALQNGGRLTGRMALSAALLAGAIYFRSELYILAVALGIGLALLAWRRHLPRRSLALWLATFLAALAPLWAFYAVSEGTLLPLHAMWYFAGSDSSGAGTTLPGQFELPALRYIATAGWRVVPDFLFGPSAPLSPVLPLWAEITGLAGVALCLMAALMGLVKGGATIAWRLAAFALGLALIVLTTGATLLSGMPYYNLHGFLLAAPFVALALWPVSAAGAKEPHIPVLPAQLLYGVTLAYVALHTLIISAFSGLGPISSHEWGQRYLLPAYPPLAALALLALWRIWAAYGQDMRLRAYTGACMALGCATLLVALGFSMRGYAVLHQERAQVNAWRALVKVLPGREPMVTDLWWLPLNLAADFYTRPMMLADSNDRLTAWAKQMQAKGVTSFGLMTNNPRILSESWQKQIAGLRANGPPQESQGMYLQMYIVGPK